MNNRKTPEVNAGSMADIAFLLLIFFLVTTTMDTELGIYKKLADKNTSTSININKRNVFEIAINSNNEIQIENSQIIDLKNIKQFVMDFIDNGARTDIEGNTCSWCNGYKDLSSSDHPAKAIVTLQSNRSAKYSTYIAVHNEIISAYNELRNKLAISLYGESFDKLLVSFSADKNNLKLKAQIDEIKQKYPIHVSEIEPNK